MQVEPRFTMDSVLMAELTVELENPASTFSAGFAVRHARGDLATADYARFWIEAVNGLSQLRVFGFTAHEPESEIGAILQAESVKGNRFRIGFKFGHGDPVCHDPPWGRHGAGITCPADADHPDISCGSCGLCVSTREWIAFKWH
jgi:hypothetical protein